MKLLHTQFNAADLKPDEIGENITELEALTVKMLYFLSENECPDDFAVFSVLNTKKKPSLKLTYAAFESDEDRKSWLNATEKEKQRIRDKIYIKHISQCSMLLLGSLIVKQAPKIVSNFLISLNER